MPAVTKTATKIDAELPSRLRLVLMRLARRLRQQHDTDATASQLSALSSVAAHGPLTLGELAALERVAPPSMTRIVSHLEDHNLVLRATDPADRRVARVTVTADGERLLRQSRQAKTAYLAARIDRLSPVERATLQAALPVIEKLLGDPE
jgi:DNA-binding MarR family transcriptional regulator